MQCALVFDDSKLPRRAQVKFWLRRAGYASLAALARDMEVHHTYPGKMLVSGKETVTPEWREWLLERGCPEDLVVYGVTKLPDKRT